MIEEMASSLCQYGIALKLLELGPGKTDVYPQRGCLDCGVVHDKEDVRVSRHPVQHSGEFWQFHLERVELLAHARARVLERLDELARALVACRAELARLLLGGWRGGRGRGGDDEEGCALEDDRLGRAAGLCEGRQVFG